MNALAVFLERVAKGGGFLGGVFLIFGMLLLVGNILGRLVHFVIPGSYEMFELIMVVPVGFALLLASLRRTHVSVNLVLNHFPPRLRAAVKRLTLLLSFITWTLLTYGGASLAYENGLAEASDLLKIPYLPFRLVWVFCLCLFSLTYFLDLIRSFGSDVEK